MKLCLVCNFQFEDEQDLCPKDYSKLVPLGKDQLIGKLIQDRYRIESMIAKGSMGIVYKAVQELIGRQVAIKVLHGYLVADEESIKRFHKEAKAASRLNHPNITTLYDYGVLSSGQPYIVMDLLRGESLADVLKQRDYLPLDEAMVIFKQVCDALSEAHKRGVVHRDIKPDNIMLEYGVKGVHVKVVDFGIAKFLQESEDTLGKITKTGTVCGSPTYMSPEQCDDNEVDNRSDIYSLGVVLYETITGKVPFSSPDIYTVMTMHVNNAAPSLKDARPDIDFPTYLDGVVNTVLTKQKEDRYQCVEEFWDALQGKSASPERQQETAAIATSAQEIQSSRKATNTLTEAQVKSAIAKAQQRKLNMANDAALLAEQLSQAQADQGATVLSQPTLDAASLQMQARRALHGGDNKKVTRTIVTPAARIFGFIQQALPLFLTLALFGVLFEVVSNQARIQRTLENALHIKLTSLVDHSKHTNNASNDIDDLIAQHKWEQARTLLEKRKKSGALAEGDQDTLDAIYVRLAKKEGKSKHYKLATALLEQISTEGKKDEEVRMLLKKYRQAAKKS